MTEIIGTTNIVNLFILNKNAISYMKWQDILKKIKINEILLLMTNL
jgi:hypothetical protein